MQSRLSGTLLFRSIRLDRVARVELIASDEFQVDDVTQTGEEVGPVAGDAGMDDELEFVDESEFGEREGQSHSPDGESSHGLFLELTDGGTGSEACRAGRYLSALAGLP